MKTHIVSGKKTIELRKRNTKVREGKITITDRTKEIHEKKVIPYGNGAKLDAPKKHKGKRAFIIILKK